MRIPVCFTTLVVALAACSAAWTQAATLLPTSLPGSVLWLDATQITPQANDTDLVAWTDNSAVGTNHATTTAGQRPNYILGGFNALPTVRFTATSSDFFDLPDMTGVVAGNYTVFTVYSLTSKALAANENDRLLHIETGGSSAALQINSDGANQRIVVRNRRGSADILGSGTNGVSYGSRFENSPEVFSFTQDTSTNSVSRDGVVTAAGLGTGSGLTSTLVNTIGRRGDSLASTFLNGDISEMLIYNRALNVAERIVVENYLNAKYNLDNDGAPAFGNDHYRYDLSTNGNYDRDVLGIGRFDGGNVLTTSTSAGLTISEELNSLGAGEWVLAGHKVVENDLVNVGPLSRWARVWALDKTETDGVQATLTFDFSEAGLTVPGANVSYTLLYSPTDPFTFTSLLSANEIVGDTVSFSLTNALLQDGFYTLGILTVAPEPTSGWLLAAGLLAMIRRRRRAG